MTEIAVTKISGSGLDGELLAEAQRHLGGASEVEAMNAALLQYVESWRARRRHALERLQQMSDEGAFDYSALDEIDK
ncbi:DUF2191 domain-containing protein [Dactylosporangium sp. NPDC005555]|uniref:type II toxin-antitoxin system VapB family antitoxin n=1 Tax=Dactylosporangium sp. NPDC005555 TaxID=3154889 RepID=UPI0033B3BA2A